MMIEWSDLSPGDIIKWMPFWNGNQIVVCVLLMSKLKEDIFSTMVLDGFYSGYDAIQMYRHLLTPTNDNYGTTTMSRSQYEKCKTNISFMDDVDAQRIKKYLESYVKNFYESYIKQKLWANQMSEKIQQFLNKRSKDSYD